MRFVFRLDANRVTGLGHLMRCLTLAQALAQRGHQCQFIARPRPGHALALLEQAGFELHLLSAVAADAPAWSAVTWQQDAEEVAAVLQLQPVDWLVLDHYGLERQWQQQLRPFYRRLWVIDDLNRSHAADLLLDQNYWPEHAGRYADLPATAVRLLGPDYVLLRPEWPALAVRATAVQVKRILVLFGGSDPSNQTLKALQALEPLLAAVELDLIVGAQQPGLAQLQQFQHPHVRLHIQADAAVVAGVMQQADLAIGSGGAAVWERCYFGLPSITLAIAPHEEAFLAMLAQQGLACYLGRDQQVTGTELYQAVRAWSADYAARCSLAAQGRRLVDGQGCERVLQAVLALTL